MVLLPGCVCCGSRCSTIAQTLRNSASVSMDITVGSLSLNRPGQVFDTCGPYSSGNTFSGWTIFRGSDFSGTFSLSKIYNFQDSSSFYFVWQYVFNVGQGFSNPFLNIEAIGTVSSGVPTMTSFLVGFFLYGVERVNRAGNATAPTNYNSIGSIGCPSPDTQPIYQRPKGVDMPASYASYSNITGALLRPFTCNEDFSVESVSDSANITMTFDDQCNAFQRDVKNQTIGRYTDIASGLSFTESIAFNYSNLSPS